MQENSLRRAYPSLSADDLPSIKPLNVVQFSGLASLSRPVVSRGVCASVAVRRMAVANILLAYSTC